MSPSASPDTAIRRGLPPAVYLLGFSLFAMGSAEFLVAGVLPELADDLGVPLSAAGSVISAFAVGVVVGGPPLAVLTLRWPRRTTLVATQVAFAVAVAVGLLVDDLTVLLVARFVAGLAYAGFFAVAAVTAIGLVPAERAARASGVVVSGLTLAMVLGGPAGTLVGYSTGWRGGFWAVVALTVLGALGTRILVPALAPTTAPNVRRELRVLRQPRMALVLVATVLSTAAYMVTYNYLAAFLADVTGVAVVWVPAVLVGFGVGAFVGITVGGRFADRVPTRMLLVGAAGLAVVSSLLVLLAGWAAVVVALVVLLGVAGFVLNPAIYGRVFAIAGDAPTLSGATTVSAFQLGISLVPAFAAAVLGSGAGVGAVPWVGVLLAVLVVPVVLTERVLAERLLRRS